MNKDAVEELVHETLDCYFELMATLKLLFITGLAGSSSLHKPIELVNTIQNFISTVKERNQHLKSRKARPETDILQLRPENQYFSWSIPCKKRWTHLRAYVDRANSHLKNGWSLIERIFSSEALTMNLRQNSDI
jgi:hypothetical protein